MVMLNYARNTCETCSPVIGLHRRLAPLPPAGKRRAFALAKLTNRPGFPRDSPSLGYSVPESRTLSSGRQNVPVWLQKSWAGQNDIQVINYIASFGHFCYPFTLKPMT